MNGDLGELLKNRFDHPLQRADVDSLFYRQTGGLATIKIVIPLGELYGYGLDRL